MKQEEEDKRWEEKRRQQKELKKLAYGIYGIFIDNKLIYIGKTTNFEKRFQSYEYELNSYNKESRKIIKMIYNAKKEKKNVSFHPLITNEDFPNNTITKE